MTDHTAFYANLFKAWPTKQVGSKPTGEQLATVHGLGLRPGKQALANAMALRPEGVTGAQIIMACGAPQLNRMRGLIAAGVVKREAMVPGAQGHTVYKLTLTPKGAKVIERASANAAKAALDGAAEPQPKAKKAKATKRPAKAKGAGKAPAATPTAAAPENAPAATATPPEGITAPVNADQPAA